MLKYLNFGQILGLTIVIVSLLYGRCSHAKQIHLAIIDSGIPAPPTNLKVCPNGLFNLTGDDANGMTDNIKHGSNISGIISDKLVNVDYCAFIFKIYGNTVKDTSMFKTEVALLIMNHLDYVDIVNYSSEEPTFSNVEKDLIHNLVKYKHVKFVAAAGNRGKNLDTKCDTYSACYPGVISVGNGASNTYRAPSSNYGKRVSVWRKGNNITANGLTLSGTSMSAAIYSADLALEMANED